MLLFCLPRLRRTARILAVAGGLAAVGAVMPAASAATTAPTTCYAVTSTSTDAATAIKNNACVNFGPGVWPLTAYLTVPAGHQVYGAGAGTDATKDTILQAQGPWNTNGNEGVLSVQNDADNVLVSNLTLDANNYSAYALDARGFTADGLLLENAYCNGVGIAGTNVTLKNSTVSGNGFNCPTAPPGAGVYLTNATVDGANLNPQITNNTITSNGGPGLDDGGVNSGAFTGNTVTTNTNWAAVSLIDAQGWNVSGNTMNQPYSSTMQPYHPQCGSGVSNLPSSLGNAAIILCRVNTSVPTSNNTVSSNTISGHYGVLLIGSAPYLPTANTISSNTVLAPGSSTPWTGCADNNKSTKKNNKNNWTGNTCTGTSLVVGPTYF